MEGAKNMKLIKGDASERKFFRERNNKVSKIIIHSSINKRKNLLNYDSVNKILLKNKIRAPKLISENYKKNLIEIEDLGNKTLFKIFQKCKTIRKIELYKKVIVYQIFYHQVYRIPYNLISRNLIIFFINLFFIFFINISKEINFNKLC